MVKVSSCFPSAPHLGRCFKPNSSIWFCPFLSPTSLTDLGFGSTKELLSKGCHRIARKGVSLIKGNGVRANQQLAQSCFCYSLHHNPTLRRQSISVFFYQKPCWENTEPIPHLFTLKWLSGKTNYTQNLHTCRILKAHIVYFVLFSFHGEKHKEHNYVIQKPLLCYPKPQETLNNLVNQLAHSVYAKPTRWGK